MMKLRILITSGFLLLPLTAVMAQPLYCPQHSRYINIGMTQADVVDACGPPMSKQQPNSLVVQKVPVKQMIYTTINSGSVYPGLNSAYYDQWSLPSGTSGVSLEIDVINGKVNSVHINGSSTNALTICDGASVQVGDSENNVYTACGSPTMVNNTYINQAVPSNSKPEVWVYQVDQYQSPISLTFVNGKLQSIN